MVFKNEELWPRVCLVDGRPIAGMGMYVFVAGKPVPGLVCIEHGNNGSNALKPNMYDLLRAERVIERYKVEVDANSTADYDARRAVAFDDDGLMGVEGEILEFTERLPFGWSVDFEDEATESFRVALIMAVRKYQEELRGYFA